MSALQRCLRIHLNSLEMYWLSDAQEQYIGVCWLVLRAERAISNTKAYQSLLDVPPPEELDYYY